VPLCNHDIDGLAKMPHAAELQFGSDRGLFANGLAFAPRRVRVRAMRIQDMMFIVLLGGLLCSCYGGVNPRGPESVNLAERGSPTPQEPSMTLEERLAAPADVAAAPADATVTESGLAFKMLSGQGGDARPSVDATVEVHYTGWTTDGKRFDSSLERGATTKFPLKGVIRGWTEGLQHMSKGDMFRFWIPGALAYGETPRRPGAPAGTLVFDVELIDFVEPPRVDTPEDVSGPPASATTTASGLAYRVLTPGTGDRHPTKESQVTVHYSGWTTDGQGFDSSVLRGSPATFPLSGVIAGWTEGVQLMVIGETTRFWIPADLAYGDPPRRPGAPAGMLVFDVELLEIQ
jgi:FKBP-type peptidyl-prolyl cis-trans isomerase